MVVLVGASMALNGDVTHGGTVIVASLWYMYGYFFNPCPKLHKELSFNKASAAMGRVFEFF